MDDRPSVSALTQATRRAARRALRRRSAHVDQRSRERELISIGEELVRRSAAAFKKALAEA